VGKDGDETAKRKEDHRYEKNGTWERKGCGRGCEDVKKSERKKIPSSSYRGGKGRRKGTTGEKKEKLIKKEEVDENLKIRGWGLPGSKGKEF